MKTSGQNQLKVSIVTFLMCVIQVNGIVLIITASTPYTYESTAVSLTCSIPAFTGGAEWIKGGVSLTQCQSSSCFPPNTGRYQYSATPTDITLAISSLDITQDETTWTCAHNAGADTGVHSLTVYKNLSAMSISGPTSSAVSNNVTVHLSVTTGCIHPSGSSYYTITWEYVEAGTTAGKLFGEETAKNFTSLGGCLNVNEDNLMLNLYFTNKINTGTTTLYISQIRMTFTMAGRNVSDSLNVTYNVTGSGKSTPSSNQCKLELGLGLGLSLGIQCSITCIVVVIFVCKGYTYAYKLGLLLGLDLGITFQVSWIIIVSLISTGNLCKLELGLGLGLGSGIPCVITFSVAVIFVCKGIPIAVDIGKGILEGLCFASVIGIIIEVFLISKKLKTGLPEPTAEEPGEKLPALKNQKNKTKPAGPPAVHTGTQNKVEPKATSKQTNDRHQRLPPVDTGVEDTPKFRPQPPPPQNSAIKDRNQREISATTDNAPGLPSETPLPSKLPPLPQKQPMVEEEDASEEPKKKRKKKKKKGQMNDGNTEEEMVQLKSGRTLPGDQSNGD